jgi:hypothetical protein
LLSVIIQYSVWAAVLTSTSGPNRAKRRAWGFRAAFSGFSLNDTCVNIEARELCAVAGLRGFSPVYESWSLTLPNRQQSKQKMTGFRTPFLTLRVKPSRVESSRVELIKVELIRNVSAGRMTRHGA